MFSQVPTPQVNIEVASGGTTDWIIAGASVVSFLVASVAAVVAFLVYRNDRGRVVREHEDHLAQ